MNHVKKDLLETRKPTSLMKILGNRGGRYHGLLDDDNTIIFSIYTNVYFGGISPDRRGLTSTLIFDTPPGAARNSQEGQRESFWQRMIGKRLMPGGLVALIWKSFESVSIYLGIVANSVPEFLNAAKESATELVIRVAFFDHTVYSRILRWYQTGDTSPGETRLLIEAPVLYEAVRPFLEALQTDSTCIPFSEYLVSHSEVPSITPPSYATAPDFRWNLSPLLRDGQDFRLDAKDSASISDARQILCEESTLDPSQAEALVDSLTRELTLIQGPPGTGKVRTVSLSLVTWNELNDR
jgi:hypothetical protein